MGWQKRAKERKLEEINAIPSKEEKEKRKKEAREYREKVKKEKKAEIKNIDEKVEKSNINLLFLSFRPILFTAIGMAIMQRAGDYTSVPNQNLWPIVFFAVNILTILLLIPLMHMQRLSFKNLFKYREKKYKWWKCILFILGLIGASVIGNILAELIMYGTIGKEASAMLQSKFKIADYFLLILLPLSTIFAEDVFYFGYISNTVKKDIVNYTIIAAIAILQHALFPFTFDLKFMGYRVLSTLPLFILYTVFYRKTKNLGPIVISHVILNLVTMIGIVML